MMSIEQVIADAREELPVLRRHRQHVSVEWVEEFINKVAKSTEDFRRYLSEEDARLRSNKSVEWLRARFPEWEAQGLAERRGRKRYYRALVIPQRPDLAAAHAAGLRGERPADSEPTT